MATRRQKQFLYGGALFLAAGLFALSFRNALVPATHPDHDHGILNLDAGGRLLVSTRDGKDRNLVGRPGRTLVVHFFSPGARGAAEELAGLFAAQKALAADGGVEWVVVAHAASFPDLDAWLASHGLESPQPATLTLDPQGETTQRLNAKRPLETMFFNSEGKLSSQARGALDWTSGLAEHLAKARAGGTIE